MARIIEAKAVISAEDRASAAFAAMAKRIAEISKAQTAFAQAGGTEFQRMQKVVLDLEGKLARTKGFRQVSRDLDAASIAYRRAQQEATRLKTAMDAAGGAGGKLARDYEQAKRASQQAADAFREQGRAARDARQGLEAAGIPINRLAQYERNLKQQIDSTTAAMRSQAEAAKRLSANPWGNAPKSASGIPLIPQKPVKAPPGLPPSLARPGVAAPSVQAVQAARPRVDLPVAEVGASFGVAKALRDTVGAGMDVDTERSQARQAGWNEPDIEKAEKRANALGAKYGLPPGAAFNIIREARPTFGGDLDTTLNNVEPFFGVQTAIRQKTPNAGDSVINKSVNDMIKAGEILGYSNDPAQLAAYADFMTRMAQVFGTQLRGEEVLNLAKRAKTAGSDVSFDFLRDVLPTLLPELGGDATGTALMTLRQALVGGKMRKRAAENLESLGLIDKKDMISTLDEDVVGVQPKAVKGSDVVRRNPLKWAQEFLIPAMDAKGVAAEDRPAIISTLFSDRNAEHMINLLVMQAARMAKDKRLVDEALGVKGVETALKDDPYLAAQRVKGGAANVGAALSDPFMGALKAAADAAANALNAVAESARGRPGETAAGIAAGAGAGGILGWLMSSGHVWWRAGMAGVGAGAGALGGGVAAGYLAPKLTSGIKGVGSVAGGEHWLPKSVEDMAGLRARISEIDAEIAGIEGRLHPSRRGEPNPDIDRLRNERSENQNRVDAALARIPAYVRDPEAFRGNGMMNIGKGIENKATDASFLQGLKAVVEGPIPVDVTGKLDPVRLEGSGRVDVTVRVEGPGAVTGVRSSSSGHINVGASSGSVGASMPGVY